MIEFRLRRPDVGAGFQRVRLDLVGDGAPGWSIDGVDVGLATRINVRPIVPGFYDVQMEAVTTEGCRVITGVRRTVAIVPVP